MYYINLLKVRSALLTLAPLRLSLISVRLACVKTPRTRSLRATVKLIIKNLCKIHCISINKVFLSKKEPF